MAFSLMKKNVAGIYFGERGLTLVEGGNKNIKNYLFQPYPKDITGPQGSPVMQNNIFDIFLDSEVEIIAFIQKVLRDARLHTNDVVVALPNRDLIVRFFEIPPVPRRDLESSINFEIKKYIPFKIDELVFDYQTRANPQSIEVLFTGIKSEQLNRYTAILSQLNLGVAAVEPAQFCILRVLRLKNILSPKEAVVTMEIEQNYCGISIIDDGFPCFTRDVKLASGIEEQGGDIETSIFKIVNELRVSLDYYRRQFSKKGVDRIVVLSAELPSALQENLNRELGLPVVHHKPGDIVGISESYSLDLAKAFGASLRFAKPASMFIDLVKKETKKSAVSLLGSQDIALESILSFFEVPKKTLIKSLVLGIIVILLTIAITIMRVQPFRQKLNTRRQEAEKVLTGELRGLGLKAILDKKTRADNRLKVYRKDFVHDLKFSEKLEVLPALMPKGVWLSNFIFNPQNRKVDISGYVFKQEEQSSNTILLEFMENLKASPVFSHKVKLIELRQVRTARIGNNEVIEFTIILTL